MALTAGSNSPFWFYVFTGVAGMFLLGIMFLDGAFVTMFKAPFRGFRDHGPGRFDNGKDLYLNYTGIPPLDLALCIVTGFWLEVVSSLPALRLQSLMLCSSLQTFAVWACIESLRRGAKHWVLRL